MGKIIDYQRYPFGSERGIAPLISGEGARAYYRRGFLSCAQDAAKALLKGNGRNHSAMPILFLYRHYIELGLKDVLAAAGAFAIDVSDQKFGHKLDDIWAEASKVFKSYRRANLTAIDEAVAELTELDKRADAFRYATNSENKPHFERIGAVNVGALFKTLNTVSSALEKLLDEMERDEAEMDAEIARAIERDKS